MGAVDRVFFKMNDGRTLYANSPAVDRFSNAIICDQRHEFSYREGYRIFIEAMVERYEPQMTLKTISDEITSRGVYSYPSSFEDGKFLLITEVDDVYFNAEIKRGFSRASGCRIPIADLIEATDVETYLAGICSRLKGEENV
jgi:hypothetical protein